MAIDKATEQAGNDALDELRTLADESPRPEAELLASAAAQALDAYLTALEARVAELEAMEGRAREVAETHYNLGDWPILARYIQTGEKP